MTKPERKPSQTIFTAEHPPEMKPAPHYRFALVPGERCVSHEVTGQVRGRGALDQVLGTRDSRAGSRATEQRDWGKSLNPSRPQAQERGHSGHFCSGPQEKLRRVKVLILRSRWQARSKQTDWHKVSASGGCQSRTRHHWEGQRGADGVQGLLGDSRTNDGVTNICLTEHRQDVEKTLFCR